MNLAKTPIRMTLQASCKAGNVGCYRPIGISNVALNFIFYTLLMGSITIEAKSFSVNFLVGSKHFVNLV